MKKKISVIIVAIVATLFLCFGLSACATKVENVHLNFVVDGQTISTIETSGKDVVTIPNNPEKEGYTFDGWYWDKDVWSNPFTANSLLNAPISSDMNVYAHFNTIEYTITYTLDTFNGWYNGTEQVTSINKGSMGNLTLTADWTVNGYEITYHNVDGATNSNPDVYDVEDEPLTLVDASKVGYTFLGWYTDAGFNNPISVIAVGTIGDKDLYAKWEIIESRTKR